MSAEPQRTCPSCGNEFSGAMEFCPVCMLRKALADGVESGESSLEEAVKPTAEQAAQRFEHYELVTGDDFEAGAEPRSRSPWSNLLTNPSSRFTVHGHRADQEGAESVGWPADKAS